ncbi:uncharacterized protein LOC143452085 [Clavelina lepadiformis]|uniref:uncharacterized protein LOC143452085 n=1 Tax=Clavelina lepadiformis TaxID=159417 RepID=UPI0040422F9E
MMTKKSLIFIVLLATMVVGAPKDKIEPDKEAKDKEKQRTPISYMTEPITEDMCKDKEYKHLHMCDILKKNKTTLKHAVDDYRCLFDDYGNHSGENGNQQVRHRQTISIQASSHASVSGTSASAHSSVSHNITSYTSHGEVPTFHKRKKRSTPDERNPCAGPLQKVIIYEAYHSDTGEVLELVQDPNQGLYQTFYIRTCNSFTHYGMECGQHDVIYRTLCYLYPPDVSDEVGTVNIRTLGSCALSIVP